MRGATEGRTTAESDELPATEYVSQWAVCSDKFCKLTSGSAQVQGGGSLASRRLVRSSTATPPQPPPEPPQQPLPPPPLPPQPQPPSQKTSSISVSQSLLPQASSGHISSESMCKHTSGSVQVQDGNGLASQQPVTHGAMFTSTISATDSIDSVVTTISKNSFPQEHHTVEEVATWLANLGYDEAALRARCEAVDGKAVVSFTDQDFRSLGLKLGPAKKLAAWICKDQADCVGAVGLKLGEVESKFTLETERTLYAGHQMACNIIFVGIGLMMANTDDTVPNTSGMVSITGGVAFIVASWLFHIKRQRTVSMHRQVSLVSSAVFTLGCTFLFVVAVSTELYFGVIYPYLMRKKQVEIND